MRPSPVGTNPRSTRRQVESVSLPRDVTVRSAAVRIDMRRPSLASSILRPTS
jgi:hypothetical protein